MAKIRYKFVNSILVKDTDKVKARTKPYEEIEYDKEDISTLEQLTLLRRVEWLANEAPDPVKYAEAWLKMSFSDMNDSSKLCLSSVNMLDNKSYSLDYIKTYLRGRKKSELLELRLVHALLTIEPIILVEMGNSLIKRKNTKGIKYKVHNREEYQLSEDLKNNITAYKKYIYEINTFETISKFINQFHMDTDNRFKGKYPGMTRAKYAFMVMALTCLPDAFRRFAEFDSRKYLAEIKNGKNTKIFIHILSCIVYCLLIEHAYEGNENKNRKAYCRAVTAKIINAFAPKNDEGVPCYSIVERGVEYALTGR